MRTGNILCIILQFISLSKPLNMKTIGGGFTFHAWVSLGPPLSFEASRALKKRMLYHFEASNGAGFQAFFRNSGKLVVATITKKGEFINLYLHDCPLSPSKWVSNLFFIVLVFPSNSLYVHACVREIGSLYAVPNLTLVANLANRRSLLNFNSPISYFYIAHYWLYSKFIKLSSVNLLL